MELVEFRLMQVQIWSVGGELDTEKIALSYVGGQHNSGTLVAVLPALSSEAIELSLSLNAFVSPQLDWNSLRVLKGRLQRVLHLVATERAFF